MEPCFLVCQHFALTVLTGYRGVKADSKSIKAVANITTPTISQSPF